MEIIICFNSISFVQDIYKSFTQEGYAVFPSQISIDKIDCLLSEVSNFKKNNGLYYSQSEHNWRRVSSSLDEYSLINSSFQNFTDILWANSLGIAGRQILQSEEVNKALGEVSKSSEFIMWQNMLFDKSTGTIDHIDSWYLDTNPYGNLLAAWIALEDIDGEGGSFHIYPKSHLDESKEWIGLDHDSFRNWSIKQGKSYKKKSIMLKKGDLLIWHPMLLHGSSLQKKVGKSRKSITAHYCPSDFLMGGGGVNQKVLDKRYKKRLTMQINLTRSFGYPIFARRSRKRMAAASILGLVKYLTGIGNTKRMLMNRSSY